MLACSVERFVDSSFRHAHEVEANVERFLRDCSALASQVVVYEPVEVVSAATVEREP